jgi:hypothetical protein
MRAEIKDGYSEFGPLLVFDDAHRSRWATKTFEQFILDEGELAEAEDGWCTWLGMDGMRQFSGTVEVLVEEPAPPHVQYAHRTARGLRLRVPTGKLVFQGRGAVISEKDRVKEEPLLVLDVPPGEYEVDAWAYLEHALRLEGEGLPGEPPPSRFRALIAALEIFGVLLALIGLILAVPILQDHAWRLLAFDLGGLAAYGLLVTLLGVITGDRRRQAERFAHFKKAVDALPPIPDFTVVLRRVEHPAARGGGVST